MRASLHWDCALRVLCVVSEFLRCWRRSSRMACGQGGTLPSNGSYNGSIAQGLDEVPNAFPRRALFDTVAAFLAHELQEGRM